VDYAILEKSEEIYCFPASFGWSDLGTWGALRENVSQDKSGNAIIGENVKTYETRDCVIHCSQERRVVVQGLEGYIVAEKDNTLLICKLSEEQRIKQFSE
jgi:mannose-1-phosphate guanylyltransferase